jgi:hypothetical protein
MRRAAGRFRPPRPAGGNARAGGGDAQPAAFSPGAILS